MTVLYFKEGKVFQNQTKITLKIELKDNSIKMEESTEISLSLFYFRFVLNRCLKKIKVRYDNKNTVCFYVKEMQQKVKKKIS
jgi:hypothetical protein